ncbi:hypothetical protein KKF84_18255 [Myxococcota bacterium]|nr:hypothetical protein [Myxococcota bacterium]
MKYPSGQYSWIWLIFVPAPHTDRWCDCPGSTKSNHGGGNEPAVYLAGKTSK